MKKFVLLLVFLVGCSDTYHKESGIVDAKLLKVDSSGYTRNVLRIKKSDTEWVDVYTTDTIFNQAKIGMLFLNGGLIVEQAKQDLEKK